MVLAMQSTGVALALVAAFSAVVLTTVAVGRRLRAPPSSQRAKGGYDDQDEDELYASDAESLSGELSTGRYSRKRRNRPRRTRGAGSASSRSSSRGRGRRSKAGSSDDESSSDSSTHMSSDAQQVAGARGSPSRSATGGQDTGDPTTSDAALLSKARQVVHKLVVCDECQEKPLVGIRFKCGACDNYDVCERCVHANKHQHHRDQLNPIFDSTRDERMLQLLHQVQGVAAGHRQALRQAWSQGYAEGAAATARSSHNGRSSGDSQVVSPAQIATAQRQAANPQQLLGGPRQATGSISRFVSASEVSESPSQLKPPNLLQPSRPAAAASSGARPRGGRQDFERAQSSDRSHYSDLYK